MTLYSEDAVLYQGIPRWDFGLDNPMINAGGVEKVRKGEKRRDDVRLGPVFTGLFSS